MKKILFVLIISVLIGISAIACNPKTPDYSTPDISDEQMAVLEGYIGAFGHVRVLGDIDHVMKGDMDATMKLSAAMSFNADKTELSIPLTLSRYDFDGHKNPEDPNPEQYTRIASGKMTLVLHGSANEDGTAFTATAYAVTGLNITLSVDDSEYIYLNLPDATLSAEEITGIFTTAGGVSRSSVTVSITDGKATGIADVDTPKFGRPAGAILFDGAKAEL